MKRTLTILTALFLVGGSLFFQQTPGLAQQASGPFFIFFPIIQAPGHIYFPMVLNAYPKNWDGPVGGTIPSIVYDPSHPSIIYLASWDGGVYKSEDDGEHWEQKNQGLPTVQILSLAIDPTDPQVLYAGPYPYGIYKSTDGGESWTSINQGIQSTAVVYSIAIDPSNPANLYASTRNFNNPFNPPWHGILYRSTNGGETWSPSLTNAGGSGEQDWIYSIAIDPKQPSTLYAAAHETGAYRSTDSGRTWQEIKTGLFDPTGRWILIDSSVSDRTVLFLGVWHRTAVFISFNGGDRWDATGKMSDAKVCSLAIAHTDVTALYAATANHGLFRTIDWGHTWQNIGFEGGFFYSLAVNPRDNRILLAGADGQGLWKSSDGGDHWSQVPWGFRSETSISSLSDMPARLFDD